jgi:hypothetical protein
VAIFLIGVLLLVAVVVLARGMAPAISQEMGQPTPTPFTQCPATFGGVPVFIVTLQPGTYRVRAYFGGLDTVSADGLEGDDHYRVVLWPAPAQEPVILLAQDGGSA